MEPITSVSILAELVETHFSSESYLFRGQAEDLPLVPKIGRGSLQADFLQQEQQILEEFRLRSRPHLDRMLHNDWELLAIAQHFGMATRLLDWSQNPLAALWFAVAGDPKEGDHGVVWAFPFTPEDIAQPEKETPFGGRLTKVFRPSHLTETIVAQNGWFTVHRFMQDENRFIPFDKNKHYKKQCTKLIVPRKHFLRLRHQLNRIGIDDSTMFPGLRGLCSHLNFHYAPRLAMMRFPRSASS